ncbi:MAG: hypothetical protein QOE75_570 [Solirubrobacterales bacterium]|jgi:AcrR family transcriptional regulator|nr:hypothetical protein [Solirubrobacterales bacterium]
MIVVASRHGYGDATVARVVREAGMSRATFYEHFEDRDDCFLAAFRRAAAPVRADLEAMADARDSRTPWEIIAAALAAVERDPDTARLLVLESFGGGARVRGEMEELLGLIEDSIDRYGESAPETRAEIPPRALLGGVGNLVGLRLFRREGRPSELIGDLRCWVSCYQRRAGGMRLGQEDWERLGRIWFEAASDEANVGPGPSSRLPRGRAALPAAEAANRHRDRLISATGRCSAEMGYLEMTVDDVVSRAGVTRAVFYRQFRNKEDAFLAMISHAIQAGAAAAAGSFFTDGDWPDRVWNALDSFADYVASNPDLAVAGMVDFYSAGRGAIGRSFDGRMAFTLFLEDGYRFRPEAEGLPRSCSEAIAGAIEELLRQRIVQGRTAQIRELVPQLAYVALAPFTGAEFALALVSQRCGTAA